MTSDRITRCADCARATDRQCVWCLRWVCISCAENGHDCQGEAQSPEQMLREFHASKAIHGGLMPSAPTPAIPDWVRDLRIALLAEEVRELADAAMAGDIVGIADGIADVAYVVVGTAVAYGIPFDEVFREVHRSNMTKVNTPAEAKLVKGPDYEPPRIAEVLGEVLPFDGHPCPRGVPGCDGTSCQWTCRTCGCRNCHEWACWNCGAGEPEDAEPPSPSTATATAPED